jgi:hypothetical protein
MFNRKILVVGALLCALLSPSAQAIQRDSSDDVISRVIRIVEHLKHLMPWLTHLPTDDLPIQPRP